MIARPLLACLALLIGLPAATPAHACGPDTDCVIGDRHYRVRMPEGHDGTTPVGAVVYAHGYKGSAAGTMRNEGLGKMISDLGFALIATKSSGDDWSIPHAPSGGTIPDVDELAYFDAVISDATARFPVDGNRLMATGFSAGGMMVWTLICHRSEAFAGFAPMAGTFWRPEPETCTTPPASVVHIHGDNDKIVPLAGRKIQDTHQGDVPKVLAMYRDYGGYGNASARQMGELACEQRTNAGGAILDYCQFEGGHSFRSAFVKAAIDRLREVGRL